VLSLPSLKSKDLDGPIFLDWHHTKGNKLSNVIPSIGKRPLVTTFFPARGVIAVGANTEFPIWLPNLRNIFWRSITPVLFNGHFPPEKGGALAAMVITLRFYDKDDRRLCDRNFA